MGRAIAGIGGCGMYMGLLTLLSVTTTNAERPRYLSLTGIVWGIGTVLGAVVGGSLGESAATWRWAFYLNLLVGVVAAPVYFLLLPDFKPQEGVSLRTRFAQIDYLGTLLSICCLLCIIMAMNLGGVLWTWGSPTSIALLVVSAVLLALFFLQQCFYIGTPEGNRLFPMHFWKRRSMITLFFTMSMFPFFTHLSKIDSMEVCLGPATSLTFPYSARDLWHLHHHLLPASLLPVCSRRDRSPDFGPSPAVHSLPCSIHPL